MNSAWDWKMGAEGEEGSALQIPKDPRTQIPERNTRRGKYPNTRIPKDLEEIPKYLRNEISEGLCALWVIGSFVVAVMVM